MGNAEIIGAITVSAQLGLCEFPQFVPKPRPQACKDFGSVNCVHHQVRRVSAFLRFLLD